MQVSDTDKEKLIELLTEADGILDKYYISYKYETYSASCLARVKSSVSDAKNWIELLNKVS